MKLALSSSGNTENVRHDVEGVLSELSPRRTFVVHLVADFLRELWKNAKAQAIHAYSEAINDIPYECVVCIPAMWTHAEEQKMRDAITLAGLPPPHFVGEPEAAAVYMLEEEPGVGYGGTERFPDTNRNRIGLAVCRVAYSSAGSY